MLLLMCLIVSCRQICHYAHSVVFSVEYRLAPQHPFPTAHEDAWNAFRWLQDNYHMKHLVVVGSSSGGQLAACITLRNRNWIQETGKGQPIAGVALRCPVTVDARENGVWIPEKFRESHKSWNKEYESPLLALATGSDVHGTQIHQTWKLGCS
jgi:acetyl esterase/lipase